MNGSVLFEGNPILSGSLNVNTGGNIEPLEVEINENGTREITPPSGVDGYAPITIETNVPQVVPILETLNVTQNGTYTPPTGTDGYDEIVVNVPPITPVLDDITITENGTYTPPTGTDGYNDITVNVPLPENAYLLEEYEDVPTDIASFTASDAPLKSLTASIVPVQAGSGDPSPTNVRPITGWTEEVVTRTGKNLIDVSLLGLYDVTGNNTRRVGIPITLKAGTYTISKDSGNLQLYITNKTNNYSTTEIDAYPFTFTIENDSELYIRSAVTDINQWNYTNLQVELGTTTTTYEPYAGTTTTIPFTDGQGQSVEVFGGSDEVVSGSLTVERKRVLVKNLSWILNSDGTFQSLSLNGENRNDSDTIIMCSTYKYAGIATGNTDSYNKGNNTISVYNGTDKRIYIRDDNYNNVTSFIQAMGDTEIVYELITTAYETYQQQPTSIKSLDGVNNVWASTGQIETLEFFTKEE